MKDRDGPLCYNLPRLTPSPSMDAGSRPTFQLASAVSRLSPRVQEAIAAAGGPEAAILAPAQAQPVADPGTVPLAGLIDLTRLEPEATPAVIDQVCDQALEHGFAAVSVHSGFIGQVAARLAGSTVAPCSVTGFPMGANLTAVKVFEARQAIEAGAREIDMVLAIGRLKAGSFAEVAQDLLSVARAAHAQGVLVKAILETFLLTDEEKVAACLLAAGTGIDFVKTCSGLSGGGATAEDVRLMRAAVGPSIGVKAAGGIRTVTQARAMLEAGASRLGTSAGVQIALQAAGVTAVPVVGPTRY